VLINPSTGGFSAVELTDDGGGEGLARHPIEAGEVVLGNRAYATARGLHAVHPAGAHVVARLNPHTLRVCDRNRQRISLLAEEKKVPKVGPSHIGF
jgi:hypothetical protein